MDRVDEEHRLVYEIAAPCSGCEAQSAVGILLLSIAIYIALAWRNGDG